MSMTVAAGLTFFHGPRDLRKGSQENPTCPRAEGAFLDVAAGWRQVWIFCYSADKII